MADTLTFTLSTGGLVSSQAALVSEGLVERLIGSFIADNYPNAAPNPVFQRAIDSKEVALEETSLWTVFARVMAGALGVPFFPVRSLAGSDLARQAWVGEVADPFSGEPTTVVRALTPDVTIAHGVAISPDSRYAFVTSEGVGSAPGKVDAVDLQTMTVVATVDVGQQASGIAFWKMSAGK